MKRALHRLWRQLAATIDRTGGEDALAAELEQHLEWQTEDNVRSGMSWAEARRAAILKFGSLEAAKEQYRDQRRLPFVETLLQDLRYALRSCARRPAFLLIIVLSLAIGIGLNTTIFTWLKAVYLNPLPCVKDARHLVTINAAYKFGDGYSNSYQDFVYIRDHSRLFTGLFAHEMEFLALSDGKFADMTGGGIVSANYFDVLATKIPVGRGFRPEEDQVSGRNPVIVISDNLWRTRFGANRNILGKKVQLNRVPFTVIGIAPPGFVGVYGGLRQDFWIPLHMAQAFDPNHVDPLPNGMGLQIMGRPKAGVSISAIQSELDVLSRQIQPFNHKNSPDYRAQVYPLHEAQRGFHSGLFEMVRVLAIAVAIILLLACLNAASLLVGRASERSREIGVRMSVGASRARIVRQLLTESLLIAALAGAVGLFIMYATRSIPDLLTPPGMDLYLNLGMDWTVLTFLFVVTLCTSILFGLLPAFETSKVDIVDSLKEGSGTITAGRRRTLWRKLLVTGQMALAMTALVGAALFASYLHRVLSAKLGFDTKNILTAGMDLSAAGLNETHGRYFYSESIRQLEQLPGVESAAWTTFLPMNGSGGGNRREVEVRGYSTPQQKPLSIIVDTVSAGYLRTLGIALTRGREFQTSDTANSASVLMVNHKFVDEYLKGREPIGAAVQIGGKWRSVVGVYWNYVYRSPTQPVRPTILLPLTQDYNTSAILVIRARTDPSTLLFPLRRIVREFDRNIPLTNVMTMEENVESHFMEEKVGTAGLLFFAAVACILAAIGVYAILTGFIHQRWREFAIRMALGAQPRDVRTQVLKESALIAFAGIAIGLALSVALGELLQSTMFSLSPFDPRLYWAATLVLLVTVTVSTLPPAFTASRMDANIALRSE